MLALLARRKIAQHAIAPEKLCMTVSTAKLDLDKCAEEPIRVPGSIQPHGALLLLDAQTLRILQRSANAEEVLGRTFTSNQNDHITLSRVSEDLAREIRSWLATSDAQYLRTATIGARRVQVIGQRAAQGLLLEFEEAPSAEHETLEGIYPQLAKFVEDIQTATNIEQLCNAVALQVRALTAYNRVLVYRFDVDWHGEVVGEDSDGVLPSYRGLRFPARDIPAQARELYRANRLRIIPDSDYRPVPLEPAMCPVDGKALDLSCAALRSVSPVHLEYMRNMGTRASMSISIVIDGVLWGLISCHNKLPRRVNAQLRNACDLIGKVVSLQIGALERAAYATRRIELKEIEARLLGKLGEAPSFQTGLADSAEAWLRLGRATGAAVVEMNSVICVGATPPVARIHQMVTKLHGDEVREVFATESLAALWPEFADLAEVASGVCAISISQLHASYILWFRPEIVRTVRWGGDPRKPVDLESGVLHPRHSFEVWKEHVTLQSEPWTKAELDGLLDFRAAIISIVLRRAEERAELTAQLQRSNRELESFSYSVSHDLRAPFRHIVGYTQLLRDREKGLTDLSQHYLDSINEAAANAGQLVDDLLNFSHLGRATLSITPVDVKKLLHEARKTLEPDTKDRQVEWRLGELPPVWGDVSLLRQVFVNLLHNALKYTRTRDVAVIEISGKLTEKACIYTITDNGVGFDMTYADKMFGVFQRMHRMEDYEGTGIGLALVKRIIERHKGWIEGHGEVDRGATFTFGLPVQPVATPSP